MSLAMAEIPHWWVLTARSRGRMEPVGLMAAADREEYLEPHVEWFPWASPRNKIESIVSFLTEINKMKRVIVFARAEEAPFWRLMGNYGLLKGRGPSLRGYFPDGDADIWVSP